MFQLFRHLYQGSPPGLFALVTIGLVIHISAGGMGILTGGAALTVRKGERPHRAFGNAFVLAMMTMSVAASSLATVAVLEGHASQMANVFAGIFAFYLAVTAWLTVKRPEGTIGRAERVGLFVACGIAGLCLFGLIRRLNGPSPDDNGVPAAASMIFALVAVLVAGLDLKVVLRGGIAGVPRIARHLWRMCVSLFIATGSFFLGQQKDMPASVQGSPVLIVLGFAPLVAMIFWLFWVRRAAWSGRQTIPA
jgi:uncharacterized membrane protein